MSPTHLNIDVPTIETQACNQVPDKDALTSSGSKDVSEDINEYSSDHFNKDVNEHVNEYVNEGVN